MSNLRYCNTVYLSDKVRITAEVPQNGELKDLQVLQNKMMRTVIGVKMRDKYEYQLKACRKNF